MLIARMHLLSIALCAAGATVYDAAGLCPGRPSPACAALPFPFSTAQIGAEPAMRSGSEPSHRIDLRGMLDARAQSVSLRLPLRPREVADFHVGTPSTQRKSVRADVFPKNFFFHQDRGLRQILAPLHLTT